MLKGNPKARGILYLCFIAVGVILTSLTIVFQATTGHVPQELDFAQEILAGLAGLFGFTAGPNTRGNADDPTYFPPKIRKGAHYAVGVVGLLVLVVSQYFRLTPGAEPLWLDIGNQILVVLLFALALVAGSHVVPDPPPADKAQPEGAHRYPRPEL